MITWTFLAIFFLTFSPGFSRIDAECKTHDDTGEADWTGVASDVLGIFSHIPVFGEIFGIVGDVIGFMGDFSNDQTGFSAQWEKCIQFWIKHAIDDSLYRETVSALQSMQANLKSIKETLGDEDHELSSTDVQFLSGYMTNMGVQANNVKDNIAGAFWGESFVLPYDVALLQELSAMYFIIAKFQALGTNQEAMHDLAQGFTERMKHYENFIDIINTDNLKDFHADWNIETKSEGDHCSPSGFNCYGHPHYFVHTGYLGTSEYCCECDCRDLTATMCRACDDLCPVMDGCLKELFHAQNAEASAKENFNKLLGGMKNTVTKAKKLLNTV